MAKNSLETANNKQAVAFNKHYEEFRHAQNPCFLLSRLKYGTWIGRERFLPDRDKRVWGTDRPVTNALIGSRSEDAKSFDSP